MNKSLLHFFLIATAVFHSCSDQSGQISTCAIHLKNARIAFNSYVQNDNKSALSTSLNEIQGAMSCPGTRQPAIMLKISLLSLLNKFQQGADFVDSMATKDFKMPYQKEMYSKFFKAMVFDSKGDTVQRDKLFHEDASNIFNYIKREKLPKDSVNEDAIYDLFFIESRFLDSSLLAVKIDSVASLYSKNSDFFNALKSSFYDTSDYRLRPQGK
ncbi:MAG TPA: hypothetical protein VN616_12425 [Puia sp.]|nr:hypothetical protein [Puia sp.]